MSKSFSSAEVAALVAEVQSKIMDRQAKVIADQLMEHQGKLIADVVQAVVAGLTQNQIKAANSALNVQEQHSSLAERVWRSVPAKSSPGKALIPSYSYAPETYNSAVDTHSVSLARSVRTGYFGN